MPLCQVQTPDLAGFFSPPSHDQTFTHMRESLVSPPFPQDATFLCMKPKTEELLYLLLWSCEMLARPTFRNLTESFESWAYRNGFHRQLTRLQRQKLLESRSTLGEPLIGLERILRLTEAGRLQALGGRDPEACWNRPWDGRWRLVMFDLPVTANAVRDHLRAGLRNRHFGYLQNSVWISPDPLFELKGLIARGQVAVDSLVLMEAHPCAGETDRDIVAGAWDFTEIKRLYANYRKVLEVRPTGRLGSESAAHAFRKWAAVERTAWLAVVNKDPLLPDPLLPDDYPGRAAWQLRIKALRQSPRPDSIIPFARVAAVTNLAESR